MGLSAEANETSADEHDVPNAHEWKVINGKLLRRSRILPHQRAVSSRKDSKGHGILPRLADESKSPVSKRRIISRLRESVLAKAHAIPDWAAEAIGPFAYPPCEMRLALRKSRRANPNTASQAGTLSRPTPTLASGVAAERVPAASAPAHAPSSVGGAGPASTGNNGRVTAALAAFAAAGAAPPRQLDASALVGLLSGGGLQLWGSKLISAAPEIARKSWLLQLLGQLKTTATRSEPCFPFAHSCADRQFVPIDERLRPSL